MEQPSSTTHHAHLEILEQACRRRCAAEIELESREGHRQRARMRLLACDERYVYIDRPIYLGMPLELTSDMYVTIFFIQDGERYAFRTHIAEEHRVPLSDDVWIPGFAMELPVQIIRQERRHDFRVSLGRCAEIVAHFQPLDSSPGQSGFSARLMNISAGGAAVIVIDLGQHELKKGNRYLIQFELPDLPRPFQFKTELRYVRNLDGHGYIMGLKYLAENNATAMRHAIRQMSQFVSKQLKRKRDGEE
ncbi:MAG: Flagellar brake protein YcgR [Phycisphaerae bacterium]|nr:Flagellar brake protein YcgR [Phycisphaerae bacterium]